MKDELPGIPLRIECGIINLENSYQTGSHWTCYFKRDNTKFYFDSFGNARPPKELVEYLKKDNLQYNEDRIQNYNDPPICGHLCLAVLKYLSDGLDFHEIVNYRVREFKKKIFLLL